MVLSSFDRVKELPHNGTAREPQCQMETENEELEVTEEGSGHVQEVNECGRTEMWWC